MAQHAGIRRRFDGVIFDLDGVLVSTDELHFLAWKQIADREGIPFDRHIGERLRGVSRMDSLNIILEKSLRPYSDSEKLALADAKNAVFRESLQTLTPESILPGVMNNLESLRRAGVHLAVASSSRNARFILSQLSIAECFEAIVGGDDITRAKPDPEVFLLAASKLGLEPTRCLVVEDAESGVEAALRAGCSVLGVGSAGTSTQAQFRARSLAEVDLTRLCVNDA